jgi:hypothetical protein
MCFYSKDLLAPCQTKKYPRPKAAMSAHTNAKTVTKSYTIMDRIYPKRKQILYKKLTKVKINEKLIKIC